MIVNKAALDGLFRNLRAEFNAAYAEAMVTWMTIATLVQSSTAREDYRWFSRFPQMREWVGDRTIKSLAAFGYNVANRKFEATIAVRGDDLRDDVLGIYGTQARGAGISAKLWPDELVYGNLPGIEGGVNNAFDADKGRCHDGKAFFAEDHPLHTGGPFSNKLTVQLRADSLANARASFGKARTALETMKDEEGRPMGVTCDVLLVPPALRDTASILLMSDRLGGDDPNPYKNAAELVVSPRLSSATAWFLLHTTGPLKPFIFQQRKAPELVNQMDPNVHDRAFMRDEFLFGADSRGAAAYALPQCAMGSTGADEPG